MKLIVDIGNSNVVVGLYQDGRWPHIWRFLTQAQESPAHYQLQLEEKFTLHRLQPQEVVQAWVGSVVPALTPTLLTALESFLDQPIQPIGPQAFPLLNLSIQNPGEIGTDLVANAMAALHQYQRDCIIVDFGTALTFTAVSKERQIQGVSIAPGISTAIRSLAGNTAQLPEVPLILPDSPLGKSTIHAIQSGTLYGYIGLVKEMLSQIREEVGEQYISLATGGLSAILTPLQKEFLEINPLLTLEGLKLIGERLASFSHKR